MSNTLLIPSKKTGENIVKKPIARPSNDFLNSILGVQFDVLDHGFVRVIDYMGGDDSVVQAARTSYGKGTKKTSEDNGLIRYLLRHRHTSCFEMADIKLHVKLPIFVARQWVRHRTSSLNEYSARYSLMEDEFYIPEFENIAMQSSDNKQGRGELLTKEKAQAVRDILINDSKQCYDNYSELVNEDGDYKLARELSRINLTLNCYTQWYWKINLHNLLHFLTLRIDKHAQYEIRVYAELIAEILKDWCPITYNAWIDYQVNAKTLSSQQFEIVKKALQYVNENNPDMLLKPSGLPKKEFNELLTMIIK